MSKARRQSVLDVDSLVGLRDELRLQAHLFKAELADRWKEAETRWHHIEDEVLAVRAAAGKSRAELGAAASLTAEVLRKTYKEMREAVSPH